MKIVINTSYGGFELSKDVFDELKIKWKGHGFLENKDLGIKSHNYNAYRSDKRLIDAIEKIGIKKSERHSDLRIVEIPDDIEFEIHNYDGKESIHQKHNSWY